ncbi:polysaccharide pyruvyl transferase family protein [Flavicella sediminum]|uniref:polysaccharide pyruvyl transferase family protein n=1 Tax=Flavicella sediminum TaxID=2585141 RepID=UPI00111F4E21|nr:polysaccharide pyruvyl transferase family protein [Flavicella sediminum]
MRILHTYCLNFNIGDYALGIGVKNLLRENLNVDYIAETNIQGREFTEYYINEVVNKKYDLLVIGGGGIIHGAHWPNGWFWLIDKELIKQIKIPFIVYGVGYNYWVEEGGIPQRGIDHLNETIKHAAYFSVRNDGSAKRILDQTGIAAPVIPDPGFHIDLNTEYKNFENVPYVIVQIANDKPLSRFGSIDRQKNFISDMIEVTKDLSKRYKVVYAPHVPDDVAISQEIVKDIDNAEVWDFAQFAFDHSEMAVGYYKYAEFAIAMRGHGQIVPIGFDVPVIALENHPKHRGLMEELDFLDFNVKVNQDNFKDELFSKIEKLEKEKDMIIEKCKEINLKLIDTSNKAFETIKNRINL